MNKNTIPVVMLAFAILLCGLCLVLRPALNYFLGGG